MSITSARLQTLRALTAAAQARSGQASFNHVDHELQELARSAKLSREHPRYLLQVIHGMRALESALKEVVRSHGSTAGTSLGRVLHQLNGFHSTHPAHLSARDKSRFLQTVAAVRNHYMHEANAFPNSSRVRTAVQKSTTVAA